MFATYVHDLNPIALPIYGGLALRWYGLAYLLGFVCGFLLLRSLARRGLWVLRPEKTADFIAAAALFGVFLGGRIGYILFYHLPAVGWSGLTKDPLLVFRVWEGGMASHGSTLARKRSRGPGSATACVLLRRSGCFSVGWRISSMVSSTAGWPPAFPGR